MSDELKQRVAELEVELAAALDSVYRLAMVKRAVEMQRDRWLGSSSLVARGAGHTLQDVLDMCERAPGAPK